jgi:hypothetical protein
MRQLLETVRRVFYPERMARPSTNRYVVRRDDGLLWKGPYRDGWTADETKCYVFGSHEFAVRAMDALLVVGTVERLF